MDRNKIKLNNVRSQRDVNEDSYQGISLTSDSRPLPYNDIIKVVNENEQFEKERRECTKYRFVSTVNGVFSNVLFNTMGENSWATFNETLFRDRSYPPNGLNLNQDEDFTYEESVNTHLKERDGWFGFENPNIHEFSNHEFTHMEPRKEKFDLVVKGGEDNWGITMVYPSSSLNNDLTKDGLDIISLKPATVGGKRMTAVGIPYKHNLSLRDDVKLSNIGKDGVYQVMRLGLDNGDFKENYFVIDVDMSTLNLSGGKFKKMYYGEECEYYFRVFKRLKNQDGEDLGDKDFDVYPLAFSKNVYGDNMVQLTTKKDVDMDGIVDNLGRPVSEAYLTFIKKNNKGFSNVKSGLFINNIDNLDSFRDIPDIRRIHNGTDTPFTSNDVLEESVSFNDDEFIGDLVEYNRNTLKETVLAEVHHRFNTLNREEGGTATYSSGVIDKPDDTWHGVNPNEEPPIIILMSVPLDPDPNDPDDPEGDGDSGLFRANLGHSTHADICGSNRWGHYLDHDAFNVATKIYRDSNGVALGYPGYYTDGTIVRYFDSMTLGSIEYCDTDDGSGGDGGSSEETPSIDPDPITFTSRQEGYFYKPFHRMKLREFSDYVEYGDDKTYGIPDYAEKLNDGRYIWRDLLDIGVKDKGLDYPFLNGSHYIHNNFTLGLRRQDPFNEVGLYDEGDIRGIKLSNNKKINRSGDVC